VSHLSVVLSSMDCKREYSPVEISAITRLREDDACRAIKMLVNGGMIEEITSSRFRKNRKYKSKQKSLF